MKNWEFPPSVKISKTYEFDEYELNGEKWYRIIDEDNIETNRLKKIKDDKIYT